MGDVDEYRCFVGSLAWSTDDRGLRDAFEKFGHLVEAKVVLDKLSGRSRGFGFVLFGEKRAMEEAIEGMNGMELDGRNISVEKAQPSQGGGGGGGHDRDHRRGSYGGSKGSGGGDCFKCGKPGHFARECPSGEGGRFVGRDDRRSGVGYGADRGGGRYGSRGSNRHTRGRGGPYERPTSGSVR